MGGEILKSVRFWRLVALATLVVCLLANCSGGDRHVDRSAATTHATLGDQSITLGGYRLIPVAHVDKPVAVVPLAGSDRYLVASQGGQVWSLTLTEAHPESRLVIDLSPEVSEGTGEQGLLGLAASPSGTEMYLGFTTKDAAVQIDVFDLTGTRPAATHRRTLRTVPIPDANEIGGGSLKTSEDGSLYASYLEAPAAAEASKRSTWARIERIDPTSGAVLGTISGLRDPWKFSIDAPTGDLWIGDSAGPLRETSRSEHVVRIASPSRMGDRVAAPAEIVHANGVERGECAVVGGFVYRGTRLPGLQGAYLFADYCLGLMAIHGSGSGRVDRIGPDVNTIADLAPDRDSEPLITALAGTIYRLSPA